MTATPAIEGWFTTGDEPALISSRCTSCSTVFFPPVKAEPGSAFCRNPQCDGDTFEDAPLSRRGTVWSYTDAQYQPPPPYIPVTDPFEPFALAAVALPEGLVVLGQVAAGFGVVDLRVGAEVELVVEELSPGESIWRWKPVAA
jgi:uncharacterized OB-fold protein